jgi:hypothetical protein
MLHRVPLKRPYLLIHRRIEGDHHPIRDSR